MSPNWVLRFIKGQPLENDSNPIFTRAILTLLLKNDEEEKDQDIVKLVEQNVLENFINGRVIIHESL
jgi:hypothetical protein